MLDRWKLSAVSGVKRPEKLVAMNPDVAARLARALDHWRRHDTALARAMQTAIARALKLKGLPTGVAEVLNKALA